MNSFENEQRGATLRNMFIIERIISLCAPHNCVACGAEGDLVCVWCFPDFAGPLPSRCALCRQATTDSQVCEACRKQRTPRHIWVRTGYEGLPRQLVRGLKFERQREAAVVIARLTQEALPFLSPDTIVVHVPTISRHVRQRGYDHALCVAVELARIIDRSHVRVLSRIGQRRQVGSGRKDRLQQLQGAFVVYDQNMVKGKHILLVDDVMTTGGTLLAATKVLRAAGAKTVDAVVFAQKE